MARKAYFNTLTLDTSYAPLVAAAAIDASTPTGGTSTVGSLGSFGLIFTGYIFAPAANSGATTLKGTETATEAIVEEAVPMYMQNVDLSKIQAKVGTSGTLQLWGTVD